MARGSAPLVSVVMDVVAAVLLLCGATLSLVGALGLHRFPDVFSRMHAATKPATLGTALVLSGVLIAGDLPPGARAKLVIAIIFQFLTAPVGSHMIGRAAYRTGMPGVDDLVIDDLGDDERAASQRERAAG